MSSGELLNKVTVIIPTYDESKWIQQCVNSLMKQSLLPFEIIIIDDGSTDDTVKKIRILQQSYSEKIVKLYEQKHKGPGEARNFAAKKANGQILLFIDADMTFENDFVKKITKLILEGKTIGTDSQSGRVANINNYWAKCWNMGKFAASGNFTAAYLTDLTPDKQDYGGIFRAILRKEFLKVQGFDLGGDYTDDATLSPKLQTKARIVNDAVFHHWNPDTISEVWLRARWIGAGKHFTGTLNSKIINIFMFSLPASVIKGLLIGQKFNNLSFVIFKVVYDFAVWVSVLKSI